MCSFCGQSKIRTFPEVKRLHHLSSWSPSDKPKKQTLKTKTNQKGPSFLQPKRPDGQHQKKTHFKANNRNHTGTTKIPSKTNTEE